MSSPQNPEPSPLQKAVNGLKFRAIGPALMGGRMADIAVHPVKKSTWYVAVGSGGVWKTVNAGTTWQPIFDKEASYSIACVTIDPVNHDVIWVGTGENVSGRHVGWGDGVYKSVDGGKSWKQMGLPKSEHIGKILIDPRDSGTIFVAAEGPLWSSGGERGVYKSTDGGESWTAVLKINEDTGVTDIAFDPSNPNTLYAAAYQRRRTVWAHMGGGAGSGLYKSTDGGASWRKLKTGLPKGDMGKMGLAVTPADPNLVYATIEADKKEKGFYRSTNKGESWEKRNEYISGGTGPHYYQVIEASPIDPDRVYQMDVFVHRTKDGGKNFENMETGKDKHSDNHMLWIDPDDGDHLLLGADAGLYESFDEGGSWRHFPNFPISQFYRLDVDNAEPFYNILGGAQDLGTLYGPSRTLNTEGVRNQDWWVPLGADGYHVAFDPTNPDLFYLEFQNGNIFRYDLSSHERMDIKPFPKEGEPPERWNWDAPIVISPHDSNRLYVASQRVWRSDDQGHSWTAVSPDLTRNENRYELEVGGRVWSVDDLYDMGAMSRYNTISNFSESAVAEGVLYVGTDDGLVQVSEDGGQSWRQAAPLPEVTERAFIQCVEASQHDADTVFAVADAHKFGDYAPYVFKSTDRGRSWESINGDLPENTIGWAIHQDHAEPNLLFLAAEFGIHVSINGGENWVMLKGNVPTIAFRDLRLHRRDNDLIGASFGRGFYVLDDYAPLREMAAGALEADGHLFSVRDAWWYIPYTPMQAPGQPTVGNTSFKAPNPEYGATITYHLSKQFKTQKEMRHDVEKELRKENKDIPFPGYETLHNEKNEVEPRLFILIKDENGHVIRRLKAENKEGLHRTSWDLRLSPPQPIQLKKPKIVNPWASRPKGPLVAPGQYYAEFVMVHGERIEQIGEFQSFTVKLMPNDVADVNFAEVVAFQKEVGDVMRRLMGAGQEIGRVKERFNHLLVVLNETPQADLTYFARLESYQKSVDAVNQALFGDDVRQKMSEFTAPSVQERMFRLSFGHWNTRQTPTATQRESYEISKQTVDAELSKLASLISELSQIEEELADLGAPWTPGRLVK